MVIQSETAEFLKATIETDVDPSAGTPQWAFTSGDRATPGSWVDGQWSSSGWDSDTKRIVALSPLAGSGQAADLTEGNTYWAHLRFPVGSETVVLRLGVVVVE